MRHHRLRVILLSLGVVLGYGSAYAHLVHAHHGPYAAPCAGWSWHGFDAPKDAAKKTQ